MSVYVLVHGAWGGSWCWKGMRRALQARGHEVFTPTLSGVGERSHLLSRQVADQIGALVYVDAFVPESGQSLHDTLPAEQRDAQVQGAVATGDGWKVPPIPAQAFSINARDRAWVYRQRTAQSIATFQQRLQLTGAIERIENITYILATGWKHSPFQQFYEKAKVKGWKRLTIACGHDVMLDKPNELMKVLLAVTRPTANE